MNSPGRRGIPKAESFTTEAKPAPDGALNLFLWFERAGLALDLPANLCAGSADVRRYHPVPANSVGARVHDVWLVNAAVNAEAELVIADAATPIRLRCRAHGDGVPKVIAINASIEPRTHEIIRIPLPQPKGFRQIDAPLPCAGPTAYVADDEQAFRLSLPNSKARQSSLARQYSELANDALLADCKFPRLP